MSAIAFLCLVTPYLAPAQSLDPSRKITQYRLRTWSDEDGLPQNSVPAVLQLRDGTVLVATQSGLALFDGSKLAPPIWGPLAKVGLVWVNRLLEDADGTLWMATRDRGLIRVRKDGVRIFGAADGLRAESVESLYRDSAGNLWVGTSDAGLFRFDGTRLMPVPLDGSPGTDFIQAISGDSGGGIMVGTRGGLFVGTPSRWRRFGKAQGLPSDHVYALTRTPGDTAWIGTANGGLAFLVAGGVHPVSGWKGASGGVMAIERDRFGSLWIGTNGGGLYRLRNGRLETLTTANGFPTNLVWSLTGDDEGGLWVGTNGGGLVRIDDPPVSVFGAAEGLSSNVALATLQARDGTLWVGTAGGGLDAIAGGKIRHYTTANGLAANIVTALAEAPDGALWIGTAPNGLAVFRQGRLRRVDLGPAFTGAGINTIHVDSRDRIWVGGNGAGVAVRENNRWQFFKSPESLPSNFVQAMASDASGRMYIATREGVVAFDGLHPIRQPAFADPLKNAFISIHLSPTGSIWLGTSRPGLARLRGGRLVFIPADRGLPNDGVNGILEDSRGTMWLTTNIGVFAFSRAELDDVADGRKQRVNGYSIGKAEGMRSRETNGGIDPPGWIARDGSILVPTLSGLVSVDADRIARAPTPRLSVMGWMVDGARIPATRALRLPSGAGRISIVFRVLSFMSPGALLVQYRMKGVDRGWVDAGASRSAEYTTLPPGPHVFEVRARYGLGKWSSASVRFSRDSRLWERPVAYVFALTLLAIGLFSAHRLRLRYWKGEADRFESSAAEKEVVLSAVRERESRFRALLEHASDAIFLLDVAGVISYVSPSMERITGRTSDGLLGKSLTDLIHPDDRLELQEALDTIRAHPKSPTPFRFRIERANYGWRAFSAIGSNLLGEQVVGGIIVNARDVTEQEEAENLFRQSQKMEAVGQLAGGIAHDFNNLLTVITVSSSMLLSELTDGDERREEVEEIRDAAERASALTGQLLAFSRKQVVQRHAMSLNESVNQIQRMLRRLIGEDIEVSTELDEHLAAIQADAGQIEQILTNLIVNARDAMPDGGKIGIVTRNVELGAETNGRRVGAPPGAYVLLSVNDTGTGMTSELQQRIFEPFFTTKHPGKGTGLGLATVYGVVKQSNGDIAVDSRIGEGTTVNIYFPAMLSRASDEVRRTGEQPVRGGRETILVVEDDPRLILLSARILEGFGYTIMMARNGREALDVISVHGDRIDLVVADVVMPIMGGRELHQKLLEERPSLPLLFVSGWTSDEVTRRGIMEGKAPFLQKPFTPEQLGHKVRNILDSLL